MILIFLGGLLAAAIKNMDGIGNRPGMSLVTVPLNSAHTTSASGWAWIFIIEGLVTIVAALFSYWIIQDFPDTAKFLTEEERMSTHFLGHSSISHAILSRRLRHPAPPRRYAV